MLALSAYTAAVKRNDKILKSNLPAFYIIQELKIGECFIKLEDKLCSPEAKALDRNKDLLKKPFTFKYHFYNISQ